MQYILHHRLAPPLPKIVDPLKRALAWRIYEILVTWCARDVDDLARMALFRPATVLFRGVLLNSWRKVRGSAHLCTDIKPKGTLSWMCIVVQIKLSGDHPLCEVSSVERLLGPRSGLHTTGEDEEVKRQCTISHEASQQLDSAGMWSVALVQSLH